MVNALRIEAIIEEAVFLLSFQTQGSTKLVLPRHSWLFQKTPTGLEPPRTWVEEQPKGCRHDRGTKMLSSEGMAEDQATNHWKHPVSFTRGISGCGPLYLLHL